MIHNSQSMDRPVTAQRSPRVIAAVVAGLVLLTMLAIAFPALRRWVRAEKSVDAKTVRLATVSRGDLLRDLSVQGRVVRVVDRGRGMSDEVMRQVLVPFYTTKPGGSGLGLALCNEIVEAHGGRLRLAGREGGGTVVTMWIPIG